MPRNLGGADPAAVEAVAVVRRRSSAALRRGKPTRRKPAPAPAAPAPAPAPAARPARVSGKGRPRRLPASAVGRCGVTTLPGTAPAAPARKPAGPRIHDLPAPVAGETLRYVDGAPCIVDRATGEILESGVVFAGPTYRPALAGKARRR